VSYPVAPVVGLVVVGLVLQCSRYVIDLLEVARLSLITATAPVRSPAAQALVDVESMCQLE
jgi:hypothetical protein